MRVWHNKIFEAVTATHWVYNTEKKVLCNILSVKSLYLYYVHFILINTKYSTVRTLTIKQHKRSYIRFFRKTRPNLRLFRLYYGSYHYLILWRKKWRVKEYLYNIERKNSIHIQHKHIFYSFIFVCIAICLFDSHVQHMLF